MSRWIDADAVIARIAGQMSYEIEVETGNETDCVDLAEELLNDIPSIDIVRCRECIYYDPPHVDDNGKRIEYKDLPKEAFDKLGTGFVDMSYGINVGGRCCVDYNCGYAEDKRVYRAEDNFCSKGRRPLYSSEKPNNSTRSKMEQVDEPKTQTETQNSNLTFKKDECAKEYEELGLKELKELVETDRKTEPQRNMAEDIVESFGFKAESYRQAKAKTEQTEREDER